ncbi:hypothetical protein Tco_0472597 [Tanacetum coccineum]
MTTLKFADTHNLVAFLEKPTESDGFEQIVDFLNVHPIKYALTVNPTIYISYIEQFWTTAKVKTINGEAQLHARVDGKKIIITESTPSGSTDNVADDAVYKELDDSLVRAATTASSLEAEQDSGNIIKTRSKATPNEAGSQGTTSGGGPRRQDTMGDTTAQTRFENVSKTSNDSLLAGVNTPQSDEDSMKLKELMKFCTKLQQRVLDLENTKTAQAQEITSLKLRVKKLEKKRGSRTHKLKRLYKVGRSARVISSDEASLGDQEDASKQGRKIDDIDKDVEITLVIETQRRYGDDLMFDTSILDDEDVFAGYYMAEKEINVAAKEVITADPVTTACEVVTTASVKISTASPTETTITNDLTLAQTLIEIKSAKSKVKGVVIREQSESTTRTRPQQLPSKDKGKGKMVEPEKPMKKKELIKLDEEINSKLQAEFDEEAKIEADHELAQRLQAQEQEELSDVEKATLFVQLLEKRRKHFATKRAEEKRNKPLTQAQQIKILCTYLKNMEGKKPKDLKNKSFDSIQKMFDRAFKRMDSSKRAGEELEHENVKKQKVDDDKETTELKSLMEVMPDEEEVTLDAIPLPVKSPSIVDWKIHKEGKKSYYQIIRADGSSKMYLVFSHMLKSFDKEDLETLYKLVKAKYGSTRQVEDLDLVLYGDLKTMFEPHVEDNVWKNQSDYRVLD